MYGGTGDLTSPSFGLAAMHKMHAVLKLLLICAFSTKYQAFTCAFAAHDRSNAVEDRPPKTTSLGQST